MLWTLSPSTNSFTKRRELQKVAAFFKNVYRSKAKLRTCGPLNAQLKPKATLIKSTQRCCKIPYLVVPAQIVRCNPISVTLTARQPLRLRKRKMLEFRTKELQEIDRWLHRVSTRAIW